MYECVVGRVSWYKNVALREYQRRSYIIHGVPQQIMNPLYIVKTQFDRIEEVGHVEFTDPEFVLGRIRFGRFCTGWCWRCGEETWRRWRCSSILLVGRNESIHGKLLLLLQGRWLAIGQRKHPRWWFLQGPLSQGPFRIPCRNSMQRTAHGKGTNTLGVATPNQKLKSNSDGDDENGADDGLNFTKGMRYSRTIESVMHEGTQETLWLVVGQSFGEERGCNLESKANSWQTAQSNPPTFSADTLHSML